MRRKAAAALLLGLLVLAPPKGGARAEAPGSEAASPPSAIDLAPILQAYPGKRFAIGQVAFSPEGRWLAFDVSDLVSGDPDQYWVFDAATRTLSPVTPMRAAGDGLSFPGSAAWGSDGTFHVRGYDRSGASRYFAFRSGTAAPDVPEAMRKRLEAIPAADDGSGRENVTRFRNLTIWGEAPGHGRFLLRLRRAGGKTVTIAEGFRARNWVLDRGQARLFFGGESGVTALDLAGMRRAALAGTLPQDGPAGLSPDGKTLVLIRETAVNAPRDCAGRPIPEPSPSRAILCLLGLRPRP